MSDTLNIELSTRQALDLARLTYQFRDFEVMADIHAILMDALEEQARPDEVEEATKPDYVYFSEFIR